MAKPRLMLNLKALRQIGLRSAGLYALYRISVSSGYYRWISRPGKEVPLEQSELQAIFAGPEQHELARLLKGAPGEQLLAEADEIVAGQARLFGAPASPLNLEPELPLRHWSYYEIAGNLQADIKYTWESARFGWALTLGRAYRLSKDERYAESFWQYCEKFFKNNPPYWGPNWSSGQEVAIRLIALALAQQMFHESPQSTVERRNLISQVIAQHAGRIPATLIYARAQNNNHLLSEAAGLYTAGILLSKHPQARKWRRSGWFWFHHALQKQIEPDGSYTQHSANYHRLILQLALWMNSLGQQFGEHFPEVSRLRLAAATHWLLSLLDETSGGVPNLGPNDGAYILPLTTCPFSDYRPVLQAAGQTFLGWHPLPDGAWDEMGMWFVPGVDMLPKETPRETPHILRHPRQRSWAYFRVAHYSSRPGHADQLHFDLWWRGLNLARDPGSFQYNAAPPWDNALTSTSVHNTITVENRDQMLRAGRFLYLDWAQAKVISAQRNPDGTYLRVAAQHDGYRHLGIIHQREVVAQPDGGWWIEDRLVYNHKTTLPEMINASLHWLTPDWPWEIEAFPGEGRAILHLNSPYGWISLQVTGKTGKGWTLQLARAGKIIYGKGESAPTWGWYSPTYGVKLPALALRLTASGKLPLIISSQWQLLENG